MDKKAKKLIRKVQYQDDPSVVIDHVTDLSNDMDGQFEDVKKQVQDVSQSGQSTLEAVNEMKPNLQHISGPMKFMSDFLNSMQGEQGEQGEQGPEGHTPVKGEDYFTPEEIGQVIQEAAVMATPVKGQDYFDGEDGKDGITPVKGKDYFTKEEIKIFKKEVTPIKNKDYFDGKDGVDGKSIDSQEVIKELKALKGNDRLDISHLRNGENLVLALARKGKIDMSDQRWHGGGGNLIVKDEGIQITPKAASLNFTGPGVTATSDADGNVTANITSGGGSGTVTSVSVVTANGVSGSVATATTTPAITLVLGAITPSSVVASGTITGSNLSGTNTGDQTITLTGDVTGSGTGSFATTIANSAVTLAKMANISTQTFLGRTTAGSGIVEDLTATQATAILNAFVGDAGAGGTKGLVPAPVVGDATKFLRGDGVFATPAGAGTVTTVSVVTANGVSGVVANPNTTPAITLTLGAITPTSIAAVGTVTGSNLSGTNTGDQTITLTGGVTGSGTGSFAATVITNANLTGDVTSVGNASTIANSAVTLAKMANISTATLLGRVTAGSGIVEDLTATQATTILNAFVGDSGAGGTKGLVPAPAIGDATKFLRGDGTFVAIAGGGTVTSVSVVTANGVSGSVANDTTTPAITLTLGAITPSSVAAVGTVTGSNLSGTNTGNQTITLTGDVTGSGTGSFAATIASSAVTLAKMANLATATFIGRTTAGVGVPEALTVTQATALLNVLVGDSGAGGTKGLVPAPAAGDAAAGKFLKADGTFAVPPGSSGPTFADNVFRIFDNVDNTKLIAFEASSIATGTTRTFTMPNASTTVVGTDVAQTLTNKTLDNTNIITISDTNLTIQDDGDATRQFKFQASGITPGVTRTLSIPNGSSELLTTTLAQTITSKTLDNTNTITIKDSLFTIQDDFDTTKQVRFQNSSLTTGTTRTKNWQDVSGTVYETGGQDVAVADGGTGQSTYTDGQLLIGNTATTSLTKTTLTAGANITITNGNGSITIAATGGAGTSFDDSTFRIYNNADNTKQIAFEASSITTGTTRTFTMPNANTTLVGTDVTQTLSGKTMTAQKIVSGDGIFDENGNAQIKFFTSASAVNQITFTNGATTFSPSVSSTGTDTNIGLTLAPKGTGQIFVPDGTALLPALAFTLDPDTGIQRQGTNNLGIICGGQLLATIVNLGGNLGGIRTAFSGTVAQPSYAFSSASTTGLYHAGSNTLGFTANGTFVALMSSTQVTLGVTGSVGVPAITFTGDTNTGLYRAGSGVLGVTTAGVSRAQFTSTGLTIFGSNVASNPYFKIQGTASGALTATVETTYIDFNLAQIRTWGAGTLVLQRAIRDEGETIAFASASTCNDAITHDFMNPIAGTNATILRAYSIRTEDVHLNGGQRWKRTATAVSYTALGSDYIIGVTSTAAARTITLPAAATVAAGKAYIIKDESGAAATNNITIAPAAGTIDGAGTIAINTNYGSKELYTDGTSWFTC